MQAQATTNIFLINIFTVILSIADVQPWVVVIAGSVAIVWTTYQLFRGIEKRKEEKRKEQREEAQAERERIEHELRMRKLRKELGEN